MFNPAARLHSLAFAFMVALTIAYPRTLHAADGWTAFRGGDGSGRSDAVGLPVEFGDGKNVVWKTAIPGKAWSSPVILDKQIWVTNATEDGRKMYGVCVDRDSGRIVHNVLVFENEKPEYCHPTNSYGSPTPVIEAGRVYLHFGTYGTVCLDTQTAQPVWSRRDLNCDHYRGPASSPILHGDLLFLSYDGIDVQYFVALNKHTGETVWKRSRDIDYGTDNGDAKKAYSTPLVIRVGGKDQLISPTAMATIAYDPATGEELWRVLHGGMNAAARPVYEQGLVYLSAGDGPLSYIAVRPTGRGDVTGSHIAWSSANSTPKRSSQVVVGDLLFMVNDSGVASCRDAQTGQTHWMKRLDGEYWASPVAADGKVYFFSKEGRVPVVAAAKDFKLLAENRFESGFNASPAIVGRALYLRTFTHLYRVEKK